jgi:hypothetical protein
MHQARIIYILAAPTKTTVRVSVYGLCTWRLVDPTWGTGGGAEEAIKENGHIRVLKTGCWAARVLGWGVHL